MAQVLRIAHVGSGRTGRIVLRLILNTPALDLVSQYVHSPNKVGRDSGDLVGEPPTGIVATQEFDTFLATDADCVTYLATGIGRAVDDVIDDHCAILASGKNIVTTALGELIHPETLGDALLTRLRNASIAGNSSLIAAGIAPGFAMDVLPVHAATLSAAPTRVAVEERILCGDYSVPGFFSALGFGTTPAADAEAYRPGTGVHMFGSSIRLMADGLGWRLDELRDHKDVAMTSDDYSCPAGEVPAGTIISVRITAEGIVNGEARLAISEIWSLSDEVVDDWEPRLTPNAPPRLTRITVNGTPSVTLDLALDGSPLPGADATAARVVNAIGAACAADPGVYGAMDLVITPAITASARL
jgi:2,4-diaminopentanoate dehydrogenase